MEKEEKELIITTAKNPEERKLLWDEYQSNKIKFGKAKDIQTDFGLKTKCAGLKLVKGSNKHDIANVETDDYTRIERNIIDEDGKKARIYEEIHRLSAEQLTGEWHEGRGKGKLMATHVCQQRKWCGEYGHLTWGTGTTNQQSRFHKWICINCGSEQLVPCKDKRKSI